MTGEAASEIAVAHAHFKGAMKCGIAPQLALSFARAYSDGHGYHRFSNYEIFKGFCTCHDCWTERRIAIRGSGGDLEASPASYCC